jgi:N-methylhydantoinase A
VTDAHVVLGRIDPHAFLGGRMVINPRLAEEAITQQIARPLGMELHEAAQGVLDVVNANMVRILRVVSITRGFDPRHFALVAYGGAGPLHAGALAQELNIPRLIVPMAPGLFSALGLVSSDIQARASMTRVVQATAENLEVLRMVFEDLTQRCHKALDREEVAAENRVILRALDMRYVRQNFELEVPVETPLGSADDLAHLLQAFHQLHTRTYGHCDETAPVQVINLKVRGVGRTPKPRAVSLAPEGDDPCEAYFGHRQGLLPVRRLGGMPQLRPHPAAGGECPAGTGDHQRVRLHHGGRPRLSGHCWPVRRPVHRASGLLLGAVKLFQPSAQGETLWHQATTTRR